jgi:hypothetical protein
LELALLAAALLVGFPAEGEGYDDVITATAANLASVHSRPWWPTPRIPLHRLPRSGNRYQRQRLGGHQQRRPDFGKFVILDLSVCTSTGNTIAEYSYPPSSNDFDIINDNQYIKGVILPDT